MYSLNICQAHKWVDYDYWAGPSYCDWSRSRASCVWIRRTMHRSRHHSHLRSDSDLFLTRPQCVPVLKHPVRPQRGPLKAHSTRKLNPPNDPGYRPAKKKEREKKRMKFSSPWTLNRNQPVILILCRLRGGLRWVSRWNNLIWVITE